MRLPDNEVLTLTLHIHVDTETLVAHIAFKFQPYSDATTETGHLRLLTAFARAYISTYCIHVVHTWNCLHIMASTDHTCTYSHKQLLTHLQLHVLLI